MLHIEGNVRQRILSLIGGEPDSRNREQDSLSAGRFRATNSAARLDETLTKADTVLAELPARRLLETRRYQMLKGEVEGTFVTLILHTLVHLGGHTQEIVAVTRLQLREGYRFMQ